MDQFAFNPTNGLADTTAFPNPTSEADTRNQLNELHIQTRDFINLMVTQINTMNTAIESIAGATGSAEAIQQILTAISEVQDFLSVSEDVAYVGDDEVELSVDEDPADDRNMHYLGREYMFYRRWDDCIATLKRHLALPRAQWRAERAASMRFMAKCYGAKKDVAQMELWLRRAMLEEPTQREAALELAELMHTQKDWPALVRACEACLAVKERRLTYLTKAEAWGARPHDLYSIGLWYTGRRKEAIKANEEAMRLDPNDKRLKENDRIMREIMAEKG